MGVCETSDSLSENSFNSDENSENSSSEAVVNSDKFSNSPPAGKKSSAINGFSESIVDTAFNESVMQIVESQD
ncbi:hypothetical protein AGMMS50239_00960 [Bacteroidia bacterium]|nr:hypothetical protein AGMMS50239_00960 [Bacteroidia bacterium]GHU64736.1 hypothetical protein FACS1894123_09910 [Bacteroidia bacterium]